MVSFSIAGCVVLYRWIAGSVLLLCSLPSFSQPLTCVPAGPRMALTFDDGPWDHHTAEVLDVLSRHGVSSTFFMVGDRVNRSSAMARRVWEEGHEIGVHTQHHQSLSKIPVSQQNLEISQNWEAIRLAVPEAPVYWWRAPYGDVPKPVPSAVNELGLHHKAWSIDTNDWRGVSDEAFQTAIFERARDGAVVLMHEHTPVTRRNLETVVVALQDAGYQLVTVSQLKLPVCAYESIQDVSTPSSQDQQVLHAPSSPPKASLQSVPPDDLPNIITY